MNNKLILPQVKKKQSRRHMLPLAIAGLVIAGGLGTIAYEVFKELPNSSCKDGNCERVVSLDLTVNQIHEEHPQDNNPERSEVINNASRMGDIELENNRLLLQRDIQRSINSTTPKKPFNYKESDFCTLTLTKDRKSLRISECTNQVFKRTLDLALSEVSMRHILEKYDFKEFNPTLEARLKF
ncbi:hypothetical protein OTK49_00590 [Vibrio coralliirubri]|uniref:hypothetical protein n=1 Tax=Vibrio coralliirubri TaxID=1516159 RepID=UPI002284E53E|nr:hypothetical protein [Vibrio coralliirubri]MCY9861039.1 hypothetical protein [Vibrio coralliirubri]